VARADRDWRAPSAQPPRSAAAVASRWPDARTSPPLTPHVALRLEPSGTSSSPYTLDPDFSFDSRAHHEPRLRRRRRHPNWRRLALAVAAPALLGLALLAPLRDAGSSLWSARPSLDQFASLAGLGIEQVSVVGQHYTLDSDVFDALDLQHALSFASFDMVAARQRIERLPWVESADIARVYPGRLDVTLKERKAYALWRRGETTYLVDVGGRVLSPVRPDLAPRLPRIAGQGAAEEAAALHATLARYPGLRDRLVEAERVGGRRWTLRLTDNVLLHLPADREVSALDAIEGAGGGLAGLLATRDRIIDLRAPGRIAVRPSAGIATADVQQLLERRE